MRRNRRGVRLQADLHNILGAAFAARGTFDQAIGEFREAVRLDSSNGQAHYNLAGLLLEGRQYEDAIGEFRAALRLMPNSDDAHDSLGIALASQGKLDEAIGEFQQALAVEPSSAEARRNLTTALQQRRPTARTGTR